MLQLNADKKAEAIQWLRSNGLGDIVKNEITVNFGQSEDNKAIAYANLAREHGYEPSQKRNGSPCFTLSSDEGMERKRQ